MSKTLKGDPKPAPFVVFTVSWNPNWNNGKPSMQRMGTAVTLEKARELIAEEERRRGEPFLRALLGPLNRDDGITRRVEIWRADWQKVE